MYLVGRMLAIVSRPPLKSLLQCKTVRKSWYSSTRERHFLEQQRSSAHGQHHHVFLLERPQSYRDPTSLFMVGEEASNKICNKLPIETPVFSSHADYKIAGSCNGLLCLAPQDANSIAPVLLVNPITRECKELPMPNFSPDDFANYCYSFGFDSITKKYKLICAHREYYYYTDYLDECVTDEDITTRGTILTVGESSWRELEIPYNVPYKCDTVFSNGVCYWKIDSDDKRFCGSEGLLALNLNTEKFHTINHPSVGSNSSTNLVNLGGTLTVVEDDELNTSFHIWQRDGCSNTWIRQHTCQLSPEIYNKYYLTLFGISNHGGVSFLYQATEKSQEYRPDCHLGIYSLQEQDFSIHELTGAPKSFHAHLFSPSDASLSDSFGSKEECMVKKKQKEEQRYKSGRTNNIQLDGHKSLLKTSARKKSEVVGGVSGLGLAAGV